MRFPDLRPAWALLPFAAWSLAAGATDLEAASRCTGLADDAARLACYDSAFGRPGAAPPRSPAQEDFGLDEATKRSLDPEKAKETLPESITATITALGRRPSGEFIATLDNGQVWVQSEVDPQARVKVGDAVTIRKAALGSFMLVTPSRVATRVRRVR